MSRITMQDVAVMSVQYVQHSFDYYLDSMERCGLRRVDLWGGAPHYCRLDYSSAAEAAAKVDGGKVFIDGQPATSYTFAMDYYFMMGDNRHNSADSRFWGFVPEDHIVGKASVVWLSIDKFKTWSDKGKVRWNRMFRKIRL